MRSSSVLSALLLAAAWMPACDGPRRPKATALRPNVLFIAVDTLRADRLGCYGNTRGLTPRIDRLAEDGARFESCFAHAPWTLPSFASIFSSLTPEEHGAGGRVPDFRALAPNIATFPECFRSAGYATGAVVNVDFLSPPFGLTRGFDQPDAVSYENNRDMRTATATTDAASRWLGEHRDGSFLLFVHYFDPHAEYRPPQPYRRKFAADVDRESDGFVFGTREQVVGLRLGQMKLAPADVERAEMLYDGEVAYADAEIGRLLDELARLGLDDTTLVVFTADHGEEFLDHGGWEHGHSLYDELLHVPLIVRQRGRIAPRVVREPVAHIDVAPTVCALGDVPAPSAFRGRDLSPILRGEALPSRSTIAFGNFWGAPLSSLRDGEFQLIDHPADREAAERWELYRWRDDAHETHDLSASEPAVRARMSAELTEIRGAFARAGTAPGPRVELTDPQRKRLNGLGYTGSDGK
jgi:arylsulfatase A-like enzyme